MSAYNFACPDWVDKLKAGKTPIADLDLDEAEGDRAVAIFDNLHLPDVPGTPALKEACGEWYRDIVRATFGSEDPETRERRVREIFALVPKKNSKTTYSAALGLTALLMNKTPNVEMMIVGPTQDIADLCFSQAKGMIEMDPPDPDTGESYLPKRFHVQDSSDKVIKCRVTGATLEVKTFDMSVVTGRIPQLTIIDELHILSARSFASRVIGQIRGGMITRPDTLLLFITTQSDQPPAGAFKTELDHARRVRDGLETGGTILPVLYEFPEAMQIDEAKPWRDPKNWPMVLPNLGRSITIDRLKTLYDKAKSSGIEEEIRWASQHLNIQIGLGLHTDRWIGADFWLKRGNRALTFEDILDTSDVVTAGIDGGGLDDMYGLALLGRHRKTRKWQAWARAWLQPEALDRRKSNVETYRDFERQGDLVICEEATQDVTEIAELLARVKFAGLFPDKNGIGLDPYGVAALIDELAGVGISEELTAIGQGTRLSPAVWGAERKLKDGTLVHGDQPLLSWCVGNARTEQRGNAVLITKAVSGTAKIDPLIALFNSVMLMSRNPEAAGSRMSPWEDSNFTVRRT